MQMGTCLIFWSNRVGMQKMLVSWIYIYLYRLAWSGQLRSGKRIEHHGNRQRLRQRDQR